MIQSLLLLIMRCECGGGEEEGKQSLTEQEVRGRVQSKGLIDCSNLICPVVERGKGQINKITTKRRKIKGRMRKGVWGKVKGGEQREMIKKIKGSNVKSD